MLDVGHDASFLTLLARRESIKYCHIYNWQAIKLEYPLCKAHSSAMLPFLLFFQLHKNQLNRLPPEIGRLSNLQKLDVGQHPSFLTLL